VRLSDGGGRIVVNPADLRRGSKRLRQLSAELKVAVGRLQQAPAPETAPPADGVPGEVHAVGARIDTLVQPLGDSAVELDRRALWAEIADELMGGYPLTGAQLAAFVSALEDGTLIKYAEPWEADLAGAWLGRMYHGTFTDPAKLRELVTTLKANGGIYDEQHGAFFAGFIREFGPANIAHISRVIQAMEWPTIWHSATDPYSDPYFDAGLMQKIDGQRFKLDDHDAVDFLLTFGMALSVATYTGQLSRWAPGAEEEIAYNPDTWGTAQLLSYKGPFGATFLRDVFQNGVLAEIGRHAGVMPGTPVSYAPIGGNDGLPTDAQKLIMDALERNPHGAALALSTPLPQQFQISYLLQGQSDPIRILYEHGTFKDGGEQFARVYTAAVNWFHHDASATGDEAQRLDDLRAANSMTLTLADETLHSTWQHVDPMDGALAHDLIDHHLDDLVWSAGREVSDPKVIGWVDTHAGNRLLFSLEGERDLIKKIAEHPDLDKTFLEAAAGHQAELIHAHTAAPPTAENSAWMNQVVGFNTVVMNAHDVHFQDQFEASKKTHELIFKLVHGTVGALAKAGSIEFPGSGAVIDIGIDTAKGATAPSQALLDQQKSHENGLVINSLNAAIATGYYDHHVIEAAPPALRVDPDDPRSPLKDYTTLNDPLDVADFHGWLYDDGSVQATMRELYQSETATMNRIEHVLLGTK
jgi:hypothetical protein